MEIKSYHVHPLWSAKNKEHPFDYDFQLLELKEALKYDENCQPVKIAHIEDMVIGKVVTVTGWGNTEENVSIFLVSDTLKCGAVCRCFS
jgi:hypothetical protein